MADAQGADRNPENLADPIEIAPRIWWVGTMLADDDLQCHSYLVEAGSGSVLIDPGSPLTVDATLDKIQRIVPLDSIRRIVCLHSDPDVAGAVPRLAEVGVEATVVTEWRSGVLMKHYASPLPLESVSDLDWSIDLDEGRCLRFLLTPYLHFPGAIVAYETSSQVLFSSDLFGGFSHGDRLVAPDVGTAIDAMRPFHEHYMPSREILAAGIDRIRRSFSPIRTIAPQHGYMIPERMVDEVLTTLKDLECGVFLLAHDDDDVAELLRIAAAMRRITDAITLGHDLEELALAAERTLPDLMPLKSVAMLVELPEEGLVVFSSADGLRGSPVERSRTAGETELRLPLPGESPRAWVQLVLGEKVRLGEELAELFDRLAPALRTAIDRHLDRRAADLEQAELEELAMRDNLTGLYNRHFLDSVQLLDQPVGVLMIDVDHFKAVNDNLGHDAGDTILREVAVAVQKVLRREDMTVRYGGEEVLVLLPGAGERLVGSVAERVRAAVEDMGIPGMVVAGEITVSVGAALQDSGTPLPVAITEADSAMYAAKQAGRNRVRLAWQP